MPSRRPHPQEKAEIGHEANNVSFFIARGEVDGNDGELITKFAGRLGLEGAFLTYRQCQEFLARQQPLPPRILETSEASLNRSYRITDINSRHQFLTLEHFENFRQLFLPPEIIRAKSKVTAAFNALVDPNNVLIKRTRSEGTLAKPPLPRVGILVKSRSELGLEPYAGPIRNRYLDTTYYSKDYAIEAGGVIELGQLLKEELILPTAEDMLVHISNRLLLQITEEAQT